MAYLTSHPIDIAGLLAEVGDSGLGGTAVFVGTVRRGPDDGPVIAIDYSAYDAMAELEFGRIVGEALARWPGARIAVRHRTGRIPTGEASVAVVAAAPHRAQAFEACRFVIEEVKVRVPVWKRELLEDGSHAWRVNKDPVRQDPIRDRRSAPR